jgi:hypothetical protein
VLTLLLCHYFLCLLMLSHIRVCVLVVLFIIMNAYLVAYSQIPVWLSHSAYWISPLSWTTRSLAINEFSAHKYDMPAPADPTVRVGDFYLQQFDLQLGMTWKWMGVVYMMGWMLVWMAICTAALNRIGLVGPQGSEREHYIEVGEEHAAERKRKQETIRAEHHVSAGDVNSHPANCVSSDHDDAQTTDIEMGPVSIAPPAVLAMAASASSSPAAVSSEAACGVDHAEALTPDVLTAIDGEQDRLQSDLARPQPSMATGHQQLKLTSLPFTPVTLAWEDLNYSVTLPDGSERVLLHSVSGFGVPKEMTALMGASGAGTHNGVYTC